MIFSSSLGKTAGQLTPPDETIEMTIVKNNAALDFVADNPELTRFHCHQQLHVDFGFIALLKYA